MSNVAHFRAIHQVSLSIGISLVWLCSASTMVSQFRFYRIKPLQCKLPVDDFVLGHCWPDAARRLFFGMKAAVKFASNGLEL